MNTAATQTSALVVGSPDPEVFFMKTKLERPLITGIYLMIINNYKIIIVTNDSLNPTHPIVVAQVKSKPNNQM